MEVTYYGAGLRAEKVLASAYMRPKKVSSKYYKNTAQAIIKNKDSEPTISQTDMDAIVTGQAVDMNYSDNWCAFKCNSRRKISKVGVRNSQFTAKKKLILRKEGINYYAASSASQALMASKLHHYIAMNQLSLWMKFSSPRDRLANQSVWHVNEGFCIKRRTRESPAWHVNEAVPASRRGAHNALAWPSFTRAVFLFRGNWANLLF